MAGMNKKKWELKLYAWASQGGTGRYRTVDIKRTFNEEGKDSLDRDDIDRAVQELFSAIEQEGYENILRVRLEFGREYT